MIQSNFKPSLLSLALVAAIYGCDDSSSGTDASPESRQQPTVVNPDIGGGKILFYSTKGEYLDTANVGNLPDMVKFNSATSLVVANEGEPEDDYVADDAGSISLITLGENKKVSTVKHLDFKGITLEGDVRIKPGSTAQLDLEPEYVAINEAGDSAWVTLQENNAVAMVDLTTETITKVKDLGKVAIANQKIDIMDDGSANPQLNAPDNIYALYMPDTIQAYSIAGQDYYVTANEGDDREYGSYEDLEKAKDLENDAEESLLSTQLQNDLLSSDAKKLRVLVDMGKNPSGIYDDLYLAGTRSFSIWDANGNRVFDSGSEFEEEIALNFASYFNTRVDDVDASDQPELDDLNDDGIAYEIIDGDAFFWEGLDARSLKKGVEPEALALQRMGEKVFAYIGLEKQGGFFVYDITQPASSNMVQYVNDIDYTALPSAAGDLAPEGMVTFQQGNDFFLAIANELSSTLALYQLDSTTGEASHIKSIVLGGFGKGAAEIVDYSPEDQSLFVTNGETTKVDVIDVSNPANASKAYSIDFSEHGDNLQSVSVKDGVLAIAVK